MSVLMADRASQDRADRRACTKIRELSHAAIRVQDIERTRAFYEDVLGLPFTYARVEKFTTSEGEVCDFIHAFFEMGSGYVAFFEVIGKGEPFKLPGDNIEIHFAMRAASVDDLKAIEASLQRHGVETMIIDHKWCMSLYFNDPDGWPLEVAYHYDHADDDLDQVADARASLATWLESHPRRATGSGE